MRNINWIGIACLVLFLFGGCSGGDGGGSGGEDTGGETPEWDVESGEEGEEGEECIPLTCVELGSPCGSPGDGCGGQLECGLCETGSQCEDGTCVCSPSCDGAECGDDGCGGSCGECGQGEACVARVCQTALCAGFCGTSENPCGPDCECYCDSECFQLGDCCEDVCSTCGETFPDNCDTTPCEPDCTGKSCGSDGCGGVCGTCEAGSSCEEGACVDCGDDCLPVLSVSAIPDEHADFAPYFSKYVNVFGVVIVGTSGVPDNKVLHAAHVMAQYLDNNEDGVVDNPLVLETMLNQKSKGSAMVMFATESEIESSGVFESNLMSKYGLQDLYGTETHPGGSSAQGGFDATLEEVLHLVTGKGYSPAYPTVFGEFPGTTIGDAMDLARGGQFMSIPSTYPEGAWYHYDDQTCDYGCMVTEYFYWALTSLLGAQDYPGRCEDIAVEWEPCTPALVESMDPAIYGLLTDTQYKLPTVIPDGSYGGQ